MYPCPRLPGFMIRLPQEPPRDDDPLDLGRPLEDRADLNVAQVSFHGVLPDVAVPAQDLDRFMAGPRFRLRRQQLRPPRNARIPPSPPRIWTALWQARFAASEANIFAIDASRVYGLPCSLRNAAR